MNDSLSNRLDSTDAGDSSDPTFGSADGTNAKTAREADANSSELPPPEFGLVDVIEAFTALRHESKMLTRENRELATAILKATEKLLQLETKISAASTPIEPPSNQAGLREFVDAIIEIDIHINHAVDAVTQSKRTSSRSDKLADSIRTEFENRGIVSRWFCQRFFKSVLQIVAHSDQESVKESTNEGLMMVVMRVRRIMSDRGIERKETVGQPFDAATMHAIAAVESNQQPAGFVEEQISPAYFWRGELFRCADVRVAK